MTKTIQFAVVGHPNKGKSSIVSTLSRNDSIEVSSHSGTTTKSDVYRVSILSKQYELVDTPGFQRPRQVFKWLQSHAQNASQRPQAVKDFVNNEETRRAFPDEVELLRPIIEGAAIIYVVDGSNPYGPEYEAEMEILRWCGQPRLALINPIQSDLHVGEWRDALGQYFSLVQVFNPFDAAIEHQQALLEAFSIIEPDWAEQLNELQRGLAEERVLWQKQAAELLAQLLDEVCNYRLSQKLPTADQADQIKGVLKKQYESWVSSKERQTHQQLQYIFRHNLSQFHIHKLEFPPELFDMEQWYLWGLDRKQLITSLTVSGMLAGGAVDMAVGGSSIMLGSVIGGVTGLASGWFGTEKLKNLSLLSLLSSEYEATYGPCRELNFPFVIVNRFLHLYLQISGHTHADRRTVEVSAPSWDETLNRIDKQSGQKLQKYCIRLARQKYVAMDDLSQTLFEMLNAYEVG